MKKNDKRNVGLRWRRFCRKSYAAFRSLHREVSIGVLGVAMLTACSFAGKPTLSTTLQSGDLLFCIEPADGGGLGEAITSVTEGVEAQAISHVAIYLGSRQGEGAAADGERWVIEAVPDGGVRLTRLEEFMENVGSDALGEPLVIGGRLRDTTDVSMMLERAMLYLGRPYDFLYEASDSAIYCSELVQISYLRSDGRAVFPTIGMTFRDASGQTAPYWLELYAQHGREVPEGEPGTNPGQLSREPSLEIFRVMP